MKRIALLLAAPMLAAIAPSSSPAAGEPREPAARDSSRDREQYERTMEERLRKLGQELDELRAQVAAAAERAGKELEQELRRAEEKHEGASRQLEKLRKESAKRWKKLAGEVNDSLSDLEKACERARSRVKE
ncbi:MAG TPA: hypothetical protein VH880_02335 [Anaeromyxobacteraceae bacterium]|jgi:hypothetical protein